MLNTPKLSRFLNNPDLRFLGQLLALTIIALVLAGLTGCDVQKQRNRKVNRAERKIFKLVTKYPELKQKDTLTITDTFTIPQVEHDTVVQLQPQDTFFYQKDRLKVRIIRTIDTFQISAKCDTQFVTRLIKAPVDKIKICPDKKGTFWYKLKTRIGWLCFLVVIVYVALRVLRHFILRV